MPKVSQFSSAFCKTASPPVDLMAVLSAIKNGRWQKHIEELRRTKDEEEFTRLKKKLPGFTVTGIFSRRNDEGFIEHSGMTQVDVDGKDNPTLNYGAMLKVVKECPYTYAAFRSPSGKGIKVLARCPEDREKHSGSYKAAAQWFMDHGIKVDTQVCALSQLCFVSYDPDLYVNKKAKAVTPAAVDTSECALTEFDETRTREEILKECETQFPDTFSDLWAGDYEHITDDHSVADCQLIGILRDNCHSNEMVAELFAESGLYRSEKWGGRTRDYVFKTLRQTSAVQSLALLDSVPEDPDDPSPVKKKRHSGWAWTLCGDIPEWKPEDDNYIVKRLLYEATVACIYGPPGSGKTFCIFSLAAAVATGTEWQGHKVKRGGVLYFGLEGHHGVKKRIQGMKKEGHLTEDAPFAPVECRHDAMNLLSEDHVTKAIETVKAFEAETGQKCKMIIIDTLARATPGGDENSTKDMGLAVINAQAIADQTGCAVVIVHHSGKSKDIRGSTALPAAFDSIYEVTRHPDDDSIRVFRIKKQRDESDSKDLYFRLKVIELGIDNDLEVVTTCLVEFLDDSAIPVKREKGDSDNATIIAHVNGDGVTVDEIADETGIARSTVQRKVKLLIAEGMLRKGENGKVFQVFTDDDDFDPL